MTMAILDLMGILVLLERKLGKFTPRMPGQTQNLQNALGNMHQLPAILFLKFLLGL